MPSDVASTPPPPSDGAEQLRQTALLLADLGRYDEAAGELATGLAAAPTDPGLLTTLARVHLAADQPAEALVAAVRAAAAAPGTIGPLVVRAMALTDTRCFAEAAQIAIEMLRRWPQDPYAQRTGAALLSESRNGQEALNAAWAAVSLSPTDAEAHLVLAVVSARLRLFDLAQRAYGETLDLDPTLGEAQRDLGVVRLERRRWARALEELADAAAFAAPAPGADVPGAGPVRSDQRESDSADSDAAGRGPQPAGPGRGEPRAGTPAPPPELIVSRPAAAVLDCSAESADTVRQAVLYTANGVLVAGLISALMATASAGVSRAWAAMIAVIVLVVVGMWLRRRLGEPVGTVLTRLRGQNRRLMLACRAVAIAPLLLLVYTAVGGLVPLAAAMVVAAAAELLVLSVSPSVH